MSTTSSVMLSPRQPSQKQLQLLQSPEEGRQCVRYTFGYQESDQQPPLFNALPPSPTSPSIFSDSFPSPTSPRFPPSASSSSASLTPVRTTFSKDSSPKIVSTSLAVMHSPASMESIKAGVAAIKLAEAKANTATSTTPTITATTSLPSPSSPQEKEQRSAPVPVDVIPSIPTYQSSSKTLCSPNSGSGSTDPIWIPLSAPSLSISTVTQAPSSSLSPRPSLSSRPTSPASALSPIPAPGPVYLKRSPSTSSSSVYSSSSTSSPRSLSRCSSVSSSVSFSGSLDHRSMTRSGNNASPRSSPSPPSPSTSPSCDKPLLLAQIPSTRERRPSTAERAAFLSSAPVRSRGVAPARFKDMPPVPPVSISVATPSSLASNSLPSLSTLNSPQSSSSLSRSTSIKSPYSPLTFGGCLELEKRRCSDDTTRGHGVAPTVVATTLPSALYMKGVDHYDHPMTRSSYESNDRSSTETDVSRYRLGYGLKDPVVEDIDLSQTKNHNGSTTFIKALQNKRKNKTKKSFENDKVDEIKPEKIKKER
ncbi:hypothetical protein BX616_005899, partial [Lobosporangium transversale]